MKAIFYLFCVVIVSSSSFAASDVLKSKVSAENDNYDWNKNGKPENGVTVYIDGEAATVLFNSLTQQIPDLFNEVKGGKNILCGVRDDDSHFCQLTIYPDGTAAELRR